MGFCHALVSQRHKLLGKPLQLLILAVELPAHLIPVVPKLPEDVQLAADEPFGLWPFYVVAGVDGYEEVVETFLHITPVKGFAAGTILIVGLGKAQCMLQSLLVIELPGEVDYLGPNEDIGAGEPPLEGKPVQ